ncbi:MAG: DNA primase, partial [Limnothrix sp.]
DLGEADQMQKIGRQSIRILAKIQDQTLRSHYLSTFAQAIGNGDRQHSQQLQENFYYQVKRLQKFQRQKEEIPAEIEVLPVATTSITLVQAEELLVRLYLHNAPYRRQIETQLFERQLMFSISHNRWLWQQIIELPIETKQNLLHNQLLGKVLDILTNHPEKMQILGNLLYLNEKTEIDSYRVPLQMQAAIATMERVNWAKHRSYCLEQWKTLDASHKDYSYYLQEFYQADQKLKEIDAERNFSNLEIIRHEV